MPAVLTTVRSVVDRFHALDADEQAAFAASLNDFVRHPIPEGLDRQTIRDHVYCRWLLMQLRDGPER